MFYNYDEEARSVIKGAKDEMLKLKHSYIGSEHLLLSLMKNKNNVSTRLKKYNINYLDIKKEIASLVNTNNIEDAGYIYTPVMLNILETAEEISKEYNTMINVDILFLSLLEESEGIAIRILLKHEIDLDKLYQEFIIKHSRKNKKKKLYIDEIGENLTYKASLGEFDPVVGRDNELNRLMEILARRTKNNPLLIGEAGVGKTAIVEELSRRIVEGNVPTKLMNKKIINLDMSSLVAGTKYRGEFEDKINKIIKEIESQDDIIIFIDEIHTLVGAGGAEGAIDAANIFKPALARNKLHCIGATTTSEYKKYIEEDKALNRRFQTILLKEPTKEVVTDIIYKLKPIYEKYHHVILNQEIIDLIITLSDKYIKNRMNPDKTIDILDEVCAHSNLKENPYIQKYREISKKLKGLVEKKKKYILENKLAKAIELKDYENNLLKELNILEVELTKNNYSKVTKKDLKEVFKSKVGVYIKELDCISKSKMIKKLNSCIFGQEDVIKELVDTYLDNLEDNRCCSVMFSGNSGVGKTKLALEFANLISNFCLRLDMSEYNEPHSVSKLLGSPAGYVGYNDTKALFENIKVNPFTVLILDEIERAHPKVIDIFLQILDNSKIKDASGQDIYFNNVMIIMTTNIVNRDIVGFNKKNTNKELNNYFGVPFINRLNNILNFNDLNEKLAEKIINKMCKEKFKNLKLTKKDIQKIIEKSSIKEYGARQIIHNIRKFKHDNLIKTN